jgi:hypothetical protein
VTYTLEEAVYSRGQISRRLNVAVGYDKAHLFFLIETTMTGFTKSGGTKKSTLEVYPSSACI